MPRELRLRLSSTERIWFKTRWPCCQAWEIDKFGKR
jgi:hypothetical protein